LLQTVSILHMPDFPIIGKLDICNSLTQCKFIIHHTYFVMLRNCQNYYISDILWFWCRENTWPFGEESVENNGTNIWTNSTAAVSFSSSNGGSVIGFPDTVFICGMLPVIMIKI